MSFPAYLETSLLNHCYTLFTRGDWSFLNGFFLKQQIDLFQNWTFCKKRFIFKNILFFSAKHKFKNCQFLGFFLFFTLLTSLFPFSVEKWKKGKMSKGWQKGESINKTLKNLKIILFWKLCKLFGKKNPTIFQPAVLKTMDWTQHWHLDFTSPTPESSWWAEDFHPRLHLLLPSLSHTETHTHARTYF